MICKNCGHEILQCYGGICGCCMQEIKFWKHKSPEQFSQKRCECGCVNPEPEKEAKKCQN